MLDSWAIYDDVPDSIDYITGDSFVLTAPATVESFQFGYWVLAPQDDTTIPDTITAVDWSITSDPLGGTTYDVGTNTDVSSVIDPSSPNTFGFNLFEGTASTGAADLPAGVYYLNLQNAAVANGDPAYWDENDGASNAENNIQGSIGSESFQILGENDELSTPEPSGLVVVGGGVLFIGGSLYRRRRRTENVGGRSSRHG